MFDWLLIQHVAHEGPGTIRDLAEQRGIRLRLCRMFAGDRLPALCDIGGVIVMGGPMGVADTKEHPYLSEELRLIDEALGANLPVLGVCLGAQLLAHALGARVYRADRAEIGAGHVTLTEDGAVDPVLGAGPVELPVIHWHSETFDLPAGAARLASSEHCAQQAFRFGSLAYGLQFHVEVDERLASSWREHLPPDVPLTPACVREVRRTGEPIISSFFDVARTASA